MSRPKGLPKTGGRKPGVRNVANQKREAEIAASGLTPLEYMLRLLRDETAPVEDRKWAAATAAPYVHPKLSSVIMSGPDDGPIRLRLSDEARSNIEGALVRIAARLGAGEAAGEPER